MASLNNIAIDFFLKKEKVEKGDIDVPNEMAYQWRNLMDSVSSAITHTWSVRVKITLIKHSVYYKYKKTLYPNQLFIENEMLF